MHETFPHDADLIVRGAVYTMDVARPVAEAFAVRDGKVAAVGDVAEMMALAGPRTRVIHSGDGMVMPGIVDIQSHVRSSTRWAPSRYSAQTRSRLILSAAATCGTPLARSGCCSARRQRAPS